MKTSDIPDDEAAEQGPAGDSQLGFGTAEQRLFTAPGLSAEEFERVGEALMQMARDFVPAPPPEAEEGPQAELVRAADPSYSGERRPRIASDISQAPGAPYCPGPDPLAAALALVAELRPVELPSAIRLTQQQMAAIPRAAAEGPIGSWAVYAGVPIEIVTEVTESTPWIEGWICCPYCGTPANGHPGVTECTAFIIAYGQHVGVVPPVPTEAGRRALAVYDPPKYP